MWRGLTFFGGEGLASLFSFTLIPDPDNGHLLLVSSANRVLCDLISLNSVYNSLLMPYADSSVLYRLSSVLGKIIFKMISNQNQNHALESDLK